MKQIYFGEVVSDVAGYLEGVGYFADVEVGDVELLEVWGDEWF